MKNKNYIPDYLRDKEYLAGEAGRFSDVPLRTVQTWTEKGLVEPDISISSGTGSKRKYSALNCIEIALIKHFADDRMKLDSIKIIMQLFKRPANGKSGRYKVSHLNDKTKKVEKRRSPTYFEERLSQGDLLRLGYAGSEGSAEKDNPSLMSFIDGKRSKDPNYWVNNTHPQNLAVASAEDTTSGIEKVVIVNLRKIADRVLKKMG